MSMEFEIRGTKELYEKMQKLTSPEPIKRGLKLGAENMVRWIRSNRLSQRSSTTLGVVTNRLRSSIASSEARQVPRGFEISIGTNVPYGRLHEFGFFGWERVREHFRKRVTGKMKLKFSPYEAQFFGGHKTKTIKTFGGGFVKAHSRFMRIPARPFLRPALEEPRNIDMVLSQLKIEITKAIRQAK